MVRGYWREAEGRGQHRPHKVDRDSGHSAGFVAFYSNEMRAFTHR
jgi:hypothetical protein